MEDWLYLKELESWSWFLIPNLSNTEALREMMGDELGL